MAKISDNTKGNKYHDEATGEFTSANEGSVSKSKIQLKGNIDVSKIKEEIESLKNPLDYDFPLPKTLSEAENIGNRILNSKVNAVGYDDTTDLEVAHNFNLALKDAVKMFPKFFTNDKVISYGTKSKVKLNRKSEYDRYLSIIQETEYAQRFQSLGVDPKVFLDVLVSSTVDTEKNFNIKDLPSGCGGITVFRNFLQHMVITDSIKLNKSYSVSMKDLENYTQTGFNNGAFLKMKKSGAYVVASHEIGHHIFNMAKGLMNSDEFSSLRKSMIHSQYLAFFGQISGYAATSFDEQIAEAFADYFGNGEGATRHNQLLVKMIKQIYDRIYGGN